MTIDTRQIIGGSVDDLAEGLRPFIERVFAERLPDGPSWVQILAHKDELAGRPTSHHHANDVGLMLRVMTEKLGNLGYPFDGRISRQATNWASEMREVRNKHAHQVEFSLAETYRALDSAELILREVGAVDEAQRIAARKPEVLSALGGGAIGRSLPSPPSAPLPAPPAVPLPATTPSETTTPSSTEPEAAEASSLTRRQRREQPETEPAGAPQLRHRARVSPSTRSASSAMPWHTRASCPCRRFGFRTPGPSFAEHLSRSKPLRPAGHWGRPRS